MSSKKLAIAAIAGLGIAATVGYGVAGKVDSKEAMQKVMHCNTVLTNGAFTFNAEQNNTGYDIKITPQDKSIELALNKDAKFHIDVEKSSFLSFGKLNLKSSGDSLKVLNLELFKDFVKDLTKSPKYNYTGTLSSSKIDSKLSIEPIEAKNSDSIFNMAQLTINSSMNINDCTGTTTLSIPTLELKDAANKGFFKMEGLEMLSEVTQKPVENVALFGKSNATIKNITFVDKRAHSPIDVQLNLNMNSETTKVDDKYMNLAMKIEAATNHKNTIMLSKGIKKGSFQFALENSEIDGMLKLVKLSQDIQKIQNDMQEAMKKGDDAASQKAIMKLQEVTTKQSISIYNKVLIKDKTRLKLNLNIESEKTSFVKLDLLYKANPVSDNIQNAMVELAAQNLAVVDGTFEIQLDGKTASTINPFATMGLEMLKAKGFATSKDGIYHLKGELKGGKIILNGKAYTLQELSKALM